MQVAFVNRQVALKQWEVGAWAAASAESAHAPGLRLAGSVLRAATGLTRSRQAAKIKQITGYINSQLPLFHGELLVEMATPHKESLLLLPYQVPINP